MESYTDEQNTKRFVSIEEANAFLRVKEETSGKVAVLIGCKLYEDREKK